MSSSKTPEKEEVLAIKSIRHGETSRIVTMFGKTHGKFAVIAKGARRSKGGTGLGSLSPPSLIEAIVYHKQSRSVQTLGQVSLIDSFSTIKTDYDSTIYSSVILQYLFRAFIDNDPHEDVFYASVKALSKLETKEEEPLWALWLFQLDLIRFSGFGIDPFTCPFCGVQDSKIDLKNRLLLEEGAFCCSSCTPANGNNLVFSGESVQIIRRLMQNNMHGLRNLRISPHAKLEITHNLNQYLKYHIPSIGKMSALEMLERL